jgi:ribosome-binding protein aMBF1 (putative translation factor)
MQDEANADGIANAGAAFASRREELGISQRQLAKMGIINASTLIAFEKGRSWPRERTRAKLERVVEWPPGMLARLYAGQTPSTSTAMEPGRSESDAAAVITGAVTVAVEQVLASAAALPDDSDASFAERVSGVLADLRTLDSVTARAVRSSQGSPEVIKALRRIRARYGELMVRAAAATGATLGQRLYTARTGASLSVAEAAGAMDVAPDVVLAAESEQPVTEDNQRRIEKLIGELAAEA